jgi:hypothetical protein
MTKARLASYSLVPTYPYLAAVSIRYLMEVEDLQVEKAGMIINSNIASGRRNLAKEP